MFGTDSEGAAYVVGGVLSAVVAGALLQLLVMTTPRPRAFFGWIMFLALVVAALIPLTWTDVTKSAVASGLLNLVIGIAIWTLLSSVLSRTLRPGQRRRVAVAPHARTAGHPRGVTGRSCCVRVLREPVQPAVPVGRAAVLDVRQLGADPRRDRAGRAVARP